MTARLDMKDFAADSWHEPFRRAADWLALPEQANIIIHATTAEHEPRSGIRYVTIFYTHDTVS